MAMINELSKDVVLQSQEVKAGVEQFKITIPQEWVSALGWEKGRKLSLTLVLGSGKIVLEGCLP